MSKISSTNERAGHHGNTALVLDVVRATGLPIGEVTSWLNVFIVAMHNRLSAGKKVHLHRVGVFWFGIRKGRTVTFNHLVKQNGESQGAIHSVQPDYKIIKFKAAKHLRDKLNKRGKYKE